MNYLIHHNHFHPAIADSAACSGLAARNGEIVGTKVVSRQDVDLGKVEEVVVNDHVAYMVLSFGGFLGIGAKLYAVLWKALQYDSARQVFVLNMTQDQIGQAPSFRKETGPKFIDERWNPGRHDYNELALC